MLCVFRQVEPESTVVEHVEQASLEERDETESSLHPDPIQRILCKIANALDYWSFFDQNVFFWI